MSGQSKSESQRDLTEKLTFLIKANGSEIESQRDLTEKLTSLIKANFEHNNVNLYYYGFYIKQMLITCEFNGVKCSYDDFYAYHDYNYGNCFRFNGNDPNRKGSNYPHYVNYPIKQSKKLGWENGLRLELYTGDQSK